MIKNWIVATYKTNKNKIAESNLQNQKFDYYLPKITIKKINSTPKEEVLFPGYIFVNTNFKNYSALKYTMGIKNIIRFGDNIAYMTDKEIKNLRKIEELSKLEPIATKITMGQEAIMAKGYFRDVVIKICSLPYKNRIDVLMTFLGSTRKVNVSEKDLIF